MNTRTAVPDDEAIDVLLETLEIVDYRLSQLARTLKTGEVKNAEIAVKTMRFIIRCNVIDFLGIEGADL